MDAGGVAGGDLSGSDRSEARRVEVDRRAAPGRSAAKQARGKFGLKIVPFGAITVHGAEASPSFWGTNTGKVASSRKIVRRDKVRRRPVRALERAVEAGRHLGAASR